MNYSDLHTKIDGYQSKMLGVLEKLVTHESPSTDKDSLDSYIQIVADRFSPLATDTTLIPNPTSGIHLRVSFKNPRHEQKKPGLLLLHYDTVWPLGTINTQPYRIDGDKAYGPGIYDMKASHVMAEFALRGVLEIGEILPRPIEILFTSDEEIGSNTSRNLIEELALQSEYVLVLEPPTAEGAIKTARKGVGIYRLKISGRAAHAGTQPELGISAIDELARQILHIQDFADQGKGTSVIVGVVKGGTRSNVVPAYAEARIDVRAWTEMEVQRIESAMRSIQPLSPGITLDVQGGFNRPPMVRNKAIADLFVKVQQIGSQLGMDLQEGSTGGGSDGNFTAALGVPTLDGLGAWGDGAHAIHEHIYLPAFSDRTALLAAALMEL